MRLVHIMSGANVDLRISFTPNESTKDIYPAGTLFEVTEKAYDADPEVWARVAHKDDCWVLEPKDGMAVPDSLSSDDLICKEIPYD